jgi:hypothetical protein
MQRILVGLFAGMLMVGGTVVVAAIQRDPPPVHITMDFGAGTPESLTFTIDEVAALQLQLDDINARTRVNEDPWTLEVWLLTPIQQQVTAAMAAVQKDEEQVACARLRALTPEERQEILDLLGGKNPCSARTR